LNIIDFPNLHILIIKSLFLTLRMQNDRKLWKYKWKFFTVNHKRLNQLEIRLWIICKIVCCSLYNRSNMLKMSMETIVICRSSGIVNIHINGLTQYSNWFSLLWLTVNNFHLYFQSFLSFCILNVRTNDLIINICKLGKSIIFNTKWIHYFTLNKNI
jgi:hypothetical protein